MCFAATAKKKKTVKFCVTGSREMKHKQLLLVCVLRRRGAVVSSLACLHDSCLSYLRSDLPNDGDSSKHIICSSPPDHVNALPIRLAFVSDLHELFNNPCAQQGKLQPAGSHHSQAQPHALAFLKGIV